jgi:D-3-phosphoglycerate dehydrogenase
VIIYDPYLSDSMADKWAVTIPPAHLHRASTLEEMLEISDVVSLHIPLLPSTENLISYDQLRIMKRHAILINTARGGIINEDDLFRALGEGLIMGAGLDAFVTEPPTRSAYPWLVSYPRVIST